jgi:hypothetical protein
MGYLRIKNLQDFVRDGKHLAFRHPSTAPDGYELLFTVQQEVGFDRLTDWQDNLVDREPVYEQVDVYRKVEDKGD